MEGVKVSASTDDALLTLRWGVSRYRVVLVACILLVVVGLTLFEETRPTHYDAEALVVADNLKSQLVALPRYGQGVFSTGEVARRITRTFGADGDPATVVPRRVSVDTPQNSLIFHVAGHDEDPDQAMAIANLAAAVFTEQLNRSGPGVGSFAVQSEATSAKEFGAGLRAPGYQLGVGLLAGTMLGLSIIGFLLIGRRPVISAEDAVALTGVPVVAGVDLGRRRDGDIGTSSGGLVPLSRRLVARDLVTLLVVGPPSRHRDTQQVIDALSAALERVGPDSRPVLVEDVLIPDWAAEPATAATLVVVFQGSSSASVRSLVADYASASLAGLIFVRARRGWHRSTG